MGAFFSNIQLYLNTDLRESFRDTVISFIKSYILENGYILVDENEKADRTIAISKIVNQPWISIYDEATEDQDTKLLDKISSQLSEKLKTRAIGIIVHDSDIIRLTAFYNGNFVGEYSNAKKRKKHTAFVDEFFSEIITKGYSIDDFLNSFPQKNIFAEETLQKIAEIINMNFNQCTVGFNYLDDINLEGLTYLKFKEKNKKNKYAQIADSTRLRFLVGDYFTKAIGIEGQIKALFRNQGLSSKGLQIILEGPAIEKNIIQLIEIKLSLYKNYLDSNDETTVNFWTTTSTKNEKLFVADFPDFIIPEGFVLPNIDAVSIKEMEEIMRKEHEISFELSIKLKGLEESKSKFYVFVLPLSNPMEGQAYYSPVIEIQNKITI